MLSVLLVVPFLLPLTSSHYIPELGYKIDVAGSANTTHLLKRGPSAYPAQDVPGPAPKASWMATYNAAKAAGKIPNFPPSVVSGSNVVYPAGTNTGAGGVCSWTINHCFGPADVVDAPTGYWGISFDDGPQLASPKLYDFLKSQNQKATHFMIGSRIIDNPAIFQQAIANGDHIASHTWSHARMTSLTDAQIVGELGWTSQIIFDQSGLLPAFWRPPYGDNDNRVRAIAKEVFGMLSVHWNADTSDWCLSDQGTSNVCGANGPQNDAGLDKQLQTFAKGPKSPGLILLEHEVSSHTVGGFVRNFATFVSAGWKPLAIPQIWGVLWYLNSVNTTSGIFANVSVGTGPGGSPPSATTTVSIPSTTVAPQTYGPSIATPNGLGSLVPSETATSAPTALPAKTTSASSRMEVPGFGLGPAIGSFIAVLGMVGGFLVV